MSHDHTELEARLSAAYDARAQLVTAESLSPVLPTAVLPAADTSITLRSHENSRKRNPWVAPLLAAAAVLALAAGVVAVSVSTRHHSHTPPVPPATHMPAPLHTSNVVLPRGQETSLADIPWNQVGPGWTLATWEKSVKAGWTVYLVNPVGGRYKITTEAPTDQLGLWSPDGHKYLDGTTEFDLTTGLTRTVTIPENVDLVSYTPTGYGFFGYAMNVDKLGNSTPVKLERFSPNGQVEATYPTPLSPLGILLSPGAPLATSDGSQVVVTSAHGLVIFGNNGQLIRSVSMPGPAVACAPVRWWNSTTILADCSPAQDGYAALWLVPLSGGTPTVLVNAASGNPQMDFGYYDAWNDSSGLVGLAGSGCGPLHLVRFPSAGLATGLSVDPPDGKTGTGQVIYLGHDADHLTSLIHSSGGCQSSATSLARSSSVTRHTVSLLGPGVNGGTVTSAIVFGGRNEPS